MSLTIEKYAPAIVGVLTASASFFINHASQGSVAQDIANPIVNILAINTGFLAAAITILLTAQEVQALKKLRTSKHFGYLVDYHSEGIVFGFFAGIVTLIVIVFCKKVEHYYQEVLFIIWIFLVAYAFAAFLRAALLLKKLVV